MTIVAVSDSKYLPRLQVLVCSIASNYPQAKLHIHLVNVSKKLEASIDFFCLQTSVSRSQIQEVNQEKFQAYCANVRARVIQSLLEGGEKFVLYLDADSIVRKPLDTLYKKVEKQDLLVLRQNRIKPVRGEHLRFAAGVIFFKNTERTRAFVKLWAEKIAPHQDEWFADQKYFAKTYDAIKESIFLGELPLSFIDWGFFPLTHIWVGKGDKKYSNKLYLLEEIKYTQNLTTRGLLLIHLRQIPLFAKLYFAAIKKKSTIVALLVRNYLLRKKRIKSKIDPRI